MCELLITIHKLTFPYGQAVFLKMGSALRKRCTQALACLIFEDSAFRKRASKRIWEVIAAWVWHLNQEGAPEEVKMIKGVGRAAHSLSWSRGMCADSGVTACWGGSVLVSRVPRWVSDAESCWHQGICPRLSPTASITRILHASRQPQGVHTAAVAGALSLPQTVVPALKEALFPISGFTARRHSIRHSQMCCEMGHGKVPGAL